MKTPKTLPFLFLAAICLSTELLAEDLVVTEETRLTGDKTYGKISLEGAGLELEPGAKITTGSFFSNGEGFIIYEGAEMTVTGTETGTNGSFMFSGWGAYVSCGTLNLNSGFSLNSAQMGFEVCSGTLNFQNGLSFALSDGSNIDFVVDLGSVVKVSGGNLPGSKADKVKILGDGRIEIAAGVNAVGKNLGGNFKEWTGTVAFASGSTGTGLKLSDYGVQGSTIELDNFSGHFAEQDGGNVAANLVLKNTVKLNGGFFSKTVTFSGNLSGDGTLLIANNERQSYKFTGDLSAFSGNFEVSSKDGALAGDLIFGEGAVGVSGIDESGNYKSVSGTGTINWGNYSRRVIYDYSNNVYATNTIEGDTSILKRGAGTLTLTGTNSYTGFTRVEAGVLIVGNSSALGAASGLVCIEKGGVLLLGEGVILQKEQCIVELDAAYATIAAIFALGTLSDTTAIFLETEAVLDSCQGVNYQIYNGRNAEALLDSVRFVGEAPGWHAYVDNNILYAAFIPEPSLFGLFAGMGALALVATRRRRK